MILSGVVEEKLNPKEKHPGNHFTRSNESIENYVSLFTEESSPSVLHKRVQVLTSSLQQMMVMGHI